VSDDSAVLSGGTGQGTAITNALLNVEDDGTFGELNIGSARRLGERESSGQTHLSDGQNVTNVQLGLLSAVNELASVHAFGGDELKLILFKGITVAENNGG